MEILEARTVPEHVASGLEVSGSEVPVAGGRRGRGRDGSDSPTARLGYSSVRRLLRIRGARYPCRLFFPGFSFLVEGIGAVGGFSGGSGIGGERRC